MPVSEAIIESEQKGPIFAAGGNLTLLHNMSPPTAMEKGEISKRKILTHCNDTIQCRFLSFAVEIELETDSSIKKNRQ